MEHAHFYVQLLWPATFMVLLHYFRIRSAYIYAVITASLLIAGLGNESRRMLKGEKGRLGFGWAYIFTGVVTVVLAVEAVTTAFDIFVPLTGRLVFHFSSSM